MSRSLYRCFFFCVYVARTQQHFFLSCHVIKKAACKTVFFFKASADKAVLLTLHVALLLTFFVFIFLFTILLFFFANLVSFAR